MLVRGSVLVVVGVPNDFLPRARAGFETTPVEDAASGIDFEGSTVRTRTAMLNAGVAIGRVAEIMARKGRASTLLRAGARTAVLRRQRHPEPFA